MNVDPKFTKEVDSLLVLQTERASAKKVFSGIDDNNDVLKDLRFTLCDRDDTSSKLGNYFMSFNLPVTSSSFPTSSTTSRMFPELQQLNVDRMVMVPIPSESYSEFIDGRTITLYVPQHGGASQTSLSAITLISSTYTSDKPLKHESSPLLGDNVVFLFSDDINTPYTGKTINDQGIISDHATNTSWNPTGLSKDRPSAVSYSEVVSETNSFFNGFFAFRDSAPDPTNQNPTSVFNTDQRTDAHFSVTVESNYPDDRAGYNYDIPVGFAVLDKGFIVLTHTAITENIPWTSGFTYGTDDAYIEGQAKKDIYFTGTTDGLQEAGCLLFDDIDTSFKMTAVCLAMPREFYISNNETWDRSKVINSINEQSGFIEFDPVFTTEVGLYNALGELIAVAKMSEPVEKNYTNVITFNVDIDM